MTILLLEPIHADAQQLLAAHDLALPPEQREDADAASVVALVTRGRERVGAAEFARYPNLRVIARCGVGVDNIDTALAAQRGVPVVYAPGSTTNAVAEHTLMLMLAAARRLHQIAAAVDRGDWGVRNGYSAIELCGRTLGVIGMGAIGQRVALFGGMIGMRVMSWNRSAQPGAQHVGFDNLLANADVVSLHVALTAETRQLIGARELALMKPSAILVNTARGGLIDQRALALALDDGRPGYFAADVLDPEPPTAHERLIGSARTLITPHTAALTDTTFRAMSLRTAHNVIALLRGEPPEIEALYQAT